MMYTGCVCIWGRRRGKNKMLSGGDTRQHKLFVDFILTIELAGAGGRAAAEDAVNQES
jgi:hypothetical protein